MLRVNCAVLAVLACWIAYEHLPPSISPPAPPLDAPPPPPPPIATTPIDREPQAHPDLPLCPPSRSAPNFATHGGKLLLRLTQPDWVLVADAATATWAAQFRFAGGARAPAGHLVNRLSGGCINRRGGATCRPRQHEPVAAAAPPSASTELRRAWVRPPSRCEGCAAGGACAHAGVARFAFTAGSEMLLHVDTSGRLGAVGARSARTTACDFAIEPVGGDGWFALRSAASGGLVRLVHAEMPGHRRGTASARRTQRRSRHRRAVPPATRRRPPRNGRCGRCRSSTAAGARRLAGCTIARCGRR